jgi:hypothetical protein
LKSGAKPNRDRAGILRTRSVARLTENPLVLPARPEATEQACVAVDLRKDVGRQTTYPAHEEASA